MEMKELSKDQINDIVMALKWKARNFSRHAKLLDSNGNVCLSVEQQRLINSLPESMRETAKKELLKENMWQEEVFKSAMELAKEIKNGKVFIQK
ncbi:hypothetical protein JZO77_16605 [Enterococcus hulanensis]|uniref:hypothetical protein n=1 Tax=Enterococcus hulanensis TaxID=2559929 RepID=UPI001A8EF672|nr:hypothetical protein [Enterococcus hulanensis]MBO0458355.1 hypothetical protein [Enterococcus hulanensis]